MSTPTANPSNASAAKSKVSSCAGDRIEDAARGMIQLRVCWVMHWLSLAGRDVPDSLEPVHQLRVWSRRTLASLHTFAEFLPPRELKWFEKQMNRVRRAAGDARDLDVLLESGKAKHGAQRKRIRRQFKRERRHAQRPIWRLRKKLIVNKRLHEHLEAMLTAIAADDDRSRSDDSLQAWAEVQVMRATEELLLAVPSDFSNFGAWHQLRIKAKQMRYTLELFTDILPKARTQSLAQVVEEIQDRLGVINDHVVLNKRLKKMQAKAARRSRAQKFRKLARHEREVANDLLGDFISGWDKMESLLRKT
ncbi:CHAD domain-containing protein [Neorhodopirellula lusitana]|uniref:CHAD domain-containing protein n=1 Tax=Neorhodopirellula lusitana TaxID=445327 RepID=UPI00384B83BF